MIKSSEMISLTEALDIVEKKLYRLKPLYWEIVPVRQALGRIMIEDQISRIDQPPFNKSSMDGFAILEGDKRREYRLIETVSAGNTPHKKLEPGTTIKVMTGAPVPEGTGCVIMVEQTKETKGIIHINSQPKDINICRKGEDIRHGETVLKAPCVLGPLQSANLIAAGIAEVKVTKPLRIAILTTGNEISDSPENLQPGMIMNSNGPMLECLCRKYSLETAASVIVPDDLEATVSAIRKALETADIVVLSGGVSVGDFDYVADAINLIKLELHFNRIAIKPGKPMTFASLDEKAVFGLPGNPVAVFLTFHLFVLYAARLMAGIKSNVHYFDLPLAEDFHRSNAERMGFLPCKLTEDGLLEQVEYHGTAHLRALLDCDGFFVAPKDVTEIKSKDKVRFLSIKDSFA